MISAGSSAAVSTAVNASGANGLFYGNAHQLAVQAAAVIATAAYSAGATFLILKLIGVFMPLRVSEPEETLGLDVSQHKEVAYQWN